VSEVVTDTKGRIEELLAGGGLRTVFHPVIKLATRRLIGYEALARFPDKGARPPNEWFADAVKAGLRTELEVAAIRLAVEARITLPPGPFLALNISPRTAVDVDLHEVVAPIPLSEIVLDINEDTMVDEFEEFGHAIEDLRSEGLRVALDDTGAGFVSLRHVVGLRPDFIKIGIEICRDVDTQVPNQAVASALCAFASRMGALTVAEGIETEAELEVLVGLGVDTGQGYLFGHPQPAESFASGQLH
jgi:EAL domain-containing protein (putative c-di-GMP-specific phosphodiesterase class I)